MKIALGADHAGFELKECVKALLEESKHEVLDLGTCSTEAVDYPDFAEAVGMAVRDQKAERGILLCGSGVGMDIVANRYPGVRAALAWEPEIGELSRKHNDSNVLVLPARFMTDDQGVETMKAWLNAKFEGGRHERRVKKIEP